MNILILNANATSIKFKIYRQQKQQNSTLLLNGRIDNIYGTNKSIFTIKDHLSKKLHEEQIKFDKDFHISAFKYINENTIFHCYSINIVINRVALGADEHNEIILLHDKSLQELSKFNESSPLNQPYNLMLAKYFMKHYPKIKHYATFDNFFHNTIPLLNRTCLFLNNNPIPTELLLNGLSHQYISKRLPFFVDHKLAKGKWIIINLDSSNSICALKNGKSIATVGGFNLLDMLPDLLNDNTLKPVIIEHLIEKYKLTTLELNCILNTEFKITHMAIKTIDKITKTYITNEDQIKFAINFFCELIANYSTRFINYLGGIDGIIFTGALGHNVPQFRSNIIEKLEWLGFELSKKANNTNKFKICKKSSTLKTLVVPMNEELAMLDHFLERHK